jgi:putative oxidoreductase
MSAIIKLYNYFLPKADSLQPLALLLVRLAVAGIFFVSGMTKIHDFDTTVALFQSEYAVPFIPPYFAALSSTFFELTCPVLLTLGVASRLATLPLLGMTAVIQFTYDQNIEHAYWAILLITVLAFGAGKWSVDYLVWRKNDKHL